MKSSTNTKAETDWAKEHPVAESSVAGTTLTLWNYPVAKSDLVREHIGAIWQFISVHTLSGKPDQTLELTVRGHASDTGNEQENIRLSQARAQKVAQYLRHEVADPRNKTVGSPRDSGFKSIDVSWAGSGEPADRGESGLALARNRRVEISKYLPSQPMPPPTLPRTDLGISDGEPSAPVAPPPEQPTSKSASKPPSSIYIEEPFNYPFPPFKHPEIVIESKLEAKLRVKVDDKEGNSGHGLIRKDGSLSHVLLTEIRKDTAAKIYFDPGSIDKAPKLKTGLQWTDVPLKPEIGVQGKPSFILLNLSFANIPLNTYEIKGLVISMTLIGMIKLEIGPGTAMIRRLGQLARGAVVAATDKALWAAIGPIAGVTAAVAGAVGVAALITGGMIYAVENAKNEGLEWSRLLAKRDGASSRVALEILGGDAQVSYDTRKAQWTNMKSSLEAEFRIGVGGVEQMLQSDERATKREAWKASFASDGTKDFMLIRERVFGKLGGYSKEGEINEGIAQLRF